MLWSLWASLIMNSMIVLPLGCNLKIRRTWRVAQSPSSGLHVLAQAPAYGFTVNQVRTLLLRLKEARISPLQFIPDEHDVSHLPAWPKQITDGHLSKLATANAAVLAALDESIPGSYLIPK
jgi:hypothetical protein